MSLSIEVDVSDLTDYMDAQKERFGDMGDMLEQFLDSQIIPQLEAQAGSQRKVHTGLYSGSWEASAIDDNSAVVTTDAYYWVFLEFGTKYIAPVPVVQDVAKEMGEPLTEYISEALGLD